MNLGIIILSNAKNNELERVTKYGLDTLFESEPTMEFDIIIVEGNRSVKYNYKDIKVIYRTDEFNYNRYMNDAARELRNRYIAFCNNDLEYTNGWATHIIDIMERRSIESASPLCRRLWRGRFYREEAISGYRIRQELAGWCLVLRRSLWERIKGFDEDVKFWCSDNAYAEQLKAIGVKHYLIPNSVVNHLDGLTSRSILSRDDYYDYTLGQVPIFKNKYLVTYGKLAV